ncbi:hypothetical protein L195_g012810 [Trifolium pratense]|uniref:Uncharacterized protein n=1 Tax=Trifolium pratense TaxID=57577 RepID=A0A2K3PLG0_TRIPR|nr:hypothetical protein L195_g012810 [Trifolium pratense]
MSSSSRLMLLLTLARSFNSFIFFLFDCLSFKLDKVLFWCSDLDRFDVLFLAPPSPSLAMLFKPLTIAAITHIESQQL